MKKLFFKLYSGLSVAIIVFIIGAMYLPEYLLRNTITEESQRITKGTFYLLKKEFQPFPEKQWPEIAKQLQIHFGYPLYLKKRDELKLKQWELQNLDQGLTVISAFDGAAHWYQRIGVSDYVLVAAMQQTQTQHTERLASGSFYLVEKVLANQPSESWMTLIDNLKPAFGFPIAIVDISEIKLNSRQYEKLAQGHIIGIGIDQHAEQFYKRINHSNYVLYAGPVGHPLIYDFFNVLIVISFALLIALVLFLWIRPLWRDISQLNRATMSFGRGQFDTRAHIPPCSSLSLLANTFDGMAERIQTLIGSHKELTNAVSHELRTPITRLRFALEMAQTSDYDEQRTRHLTNMAEDIDELDTLVAELLNYARFDRNTHDLKLSTQALVPWLEKLIARSQRNTNTLTIEWTGELPDSYTVEFEPKLMARALSNLLQNAKRYAQQQIKISALANEEICQIIVDDDGPGIPTEERERIFDPFIRLDPSRDRDTGGYGLGLSIAQRVALWHQGTIFVSDSPLGGARFTIQWPNPHQTN